MPALRHLLRVCQSFASRSVSSINRTQASRSLATAAFQPLTPIRWSPQTLQVRWLSKEATSSDSSEGEEASNYHCIITDKERSKGPAVKSEFQAETRKLLDIVAKSLYSEREVFIRELVSNASDALEKLRYLQSTGESVADGEKPLEIYIKTDDIKKTFTVQDTGIGMSQTEMMDNLGVIARSGSKDFLNNLKHGEEAGSSIIGQFGVGFYASFMVADKVDVFSKSYKAADDEMGRKWTSDGQGTYEMYEAEGVTRGTKIVLHLKGDAYDFAKEEMIEEVLKRYSNFVGVPIFLNGRRINVVQPLWMKDQSQVTDEEHEEFYRFIGNSFDKPRYRMWYKTDAPINIRALLYVPEYKPSLFEMSRETDTGVALYSRKVMIQSRAQSILPKWLRFMRGVVDSEDIPLNLSRELLQDSQLIRKLNRVLTARILKFFGDQARRDPAQYMEFYHDYGLFLKEGIVTSGEQETREDIAKLLRFESSALPAGQRTSLEEYGTRMVAGGRQVLFLAAPSRQLAEASPYLEAVRKKDNTEVLFLYEPYDELVLMQLGQFDRKNLRSVESLLTDDTADTSSVDASDASSLAQDQADGLTAWMQDIYGPKVKKVKVTQRLTTHPCVISVRELGAVRHFIRTTLVDKSEEEKLRVMEPVMEVNPSHPLIHKLASLRQSNPELATLIVHQLFDNALTQAGLLEDPRAMISRINQLLTKAVETL